MPYSYKEIRSAPDFQTVENATKLTEFMIAVREEFRKHSSASVRTMSELMSLGPYVPDSWEQMARVDWLVEEGFLHEIPTSSAGQFRCFTWVG